MSLPPRLDVLVPFWGMAGGVIKVLDYAEHAVELGVPTTMWAPDLPEETNPISSVPVTSRLLDDPLVTIRALDNLALTPHSTVLFTEVTQHHLIETAIEPSVPLAARLIHLVQGTRHGNPRWNDGRNYRLLHRPMTRIAVSTAVSETIAPLVNQDHETVMIREGHNWQYFDGRPQRAGSHDGPLRVLYTTWKSDLGDHVRAAVESSSERENIAFIPVTTPLGWPALRNRYHGADVLLCTPGPEEGFYLPGLEALAAGVCPVTALVGGNTEYVRAGENALVVPYDDVDAHGAALIELANDRTSLNQLVEKGRQVLPAHDLTVERTTFGELLSRLDSF